jgi:hypothetical protein
VVRRREKRASARRYFCTVSPNFVFYGPGHLMFDVCPSSLKKLSIKMTRPPVCENPPRLQTWRQENLWERVEQRAL